MASDYHVRHMRLPRLSRVIFSAAVALTLLSVICVIGAGFLEGSQADSIQSAAEQLEERSELDDVDQIDAIVGHETLLVSDDAVVEEFQGDHAAPPLTHLWCWRSRGPPAT